MHSSSKREQLQMQARMCPAVWDQVTPIQDRCRGTLRCAVCLGPLCNLCCAGRDAVCLTSHPSAAAAAGVVGRGGSGSNFTDYIEFQHSDDEAGDEAEELLHANGVGTSSHAAASGGSGEDWTWGRLLKDVLKVSAQQDRLS